MSRCAALPAEITAGLDFQVSVSASAGLAVTLHMRGGQNIDLTATAAGGVYTFSADAAATAAWPPGDYWFTMRAAGGGSVTELARGQVKVLPDLAAITGPYDGRSQAQIALDAIKAVLAKRATIDQQRYTINNRELWRTPIADLLKLRAFYASEVRKERGGNGKWGRAVPVQFHSDQ